jgi:hypothetical protein
VFALATPKSITPLLGVNQEQAGQKRMVAFHSRKLSPAERNCSVHDCELLGIVDATTVWRHYLLGRPFKQPHTALSLLVPARHQTNDRSVRAFVDRMHNNLRHAQANWARAQERQTHYANQKRREHKFTTGDRMPIKNSCIMHSRHLHPNPTQGS